MGLQIPTTTNVLDQLKGKNSRRTHVVQFQSLEQIRMDEEEFIEDEESKEDSEEFSRSISNTLNSILPTLVVGAEQILRTAMKARCLTSGGLQQKTPWRLKRALLADTRQEGTVAAGRLVTRWVKGDYDRTLCELLAKSELIALYKDDSQRDVRRIGVGCSLRRLLTRAYCSEIQAKVISHVSAS